MLEGTYKRWEKMENKDKKTRKILNLKPSIMEVDEEEKPQIAINQWIE